MMKLCSESSEKAYGFVCDQYGKPLDWICITGYKNIFDKRTQELMCEILKGKGNEYVYTSKFFYFLVPFGQDNLVNIFFQPLYYSGFEDRLKEYVSDKIDYDCE